MPAADVPLDHPHLTTVGLLVEAHAGLSQSLERQLRASSDLSIHWFEVLLRLARSPGERLRMSDLAAQTTLSTSGLTRAVDRLEAVGLVRREACPEDRRGSYAALTEEGRDRVDRAVPPHLEQIGSVLDQAFSPAEVDELTSLLRRLRDAANPRAARASDPDPQPLGGLDQPA
jgi:MarR family transcriptional regulator, 2-MHQ and catechol-resistance regulon repressor